MNLSKRPLPILKMLRASLLITCALSASGCGISFFSNRDTNPVIQDYAPASSSLFDLDRGPNMFATTASRRLVVRIRQPDGTYRLCAEPPPDVGESFSSAIAAGFQAAAKSGTPVTGELAAQYGRAVATQIAPLLYRTQGLQLYRDSLYRLCIDRMNGAVPWSGGNVMGLRDPIFTFRGQSARDTAFSSSSSPGNRSQS